MNKVLLKDKLMNEASLTTIRVPCVAMFINSKADFNIDKYNGHQTSTLIGVLFCIYWCVNIWIAISDLHELD